MHITFYLETEKVDALLERLHLSPDVKIERQNVYEWLLSDGTWTPEDFNRDEQTRAERALYERETQVTLYVSSWSREQRDTLETAINGVDRTGTGVSWFATHEECKRMKEWMVLP